MKKVCIVGHFGFGKNMLNGQTIKTKIITGALVEQLGTAEVDKIDTHGGMKSIIRCFAQIHRAFKTCENVIMLPAHNGVRVFTPIMLFFQRFYKRKCHYIVIGGWLPELLKHNKRLSKQLKKFDGIYVETSTMKRALDKEKFSNVIVLPNCKNLNILNEDELSFCVCEPYRLCTFSRVMKEKGIEDAVECVKRINSALKRTVFSLDIYGQIDSEQVTWFKDLLNSFPEYIRYCGVVPFDQSVNVLRDYFALLFPTRFYTEGIPGTIIDAYAAGVPVICSKWESFSDVVDDGVVGIGYEFGKAEELYNLLMQIAEEPDRLNDKKIQCIKKAEAFSAARVVNDLVGYL